ncbi:related to Hydroxyacylglutathione hydrolase, cytoplasmic isozyme [Saccharomycodes ludwigii]|uniref:hydroxyacylglutathione hydrolase n=1 Tax=Saccharomycodes ludwigii TaxID=36035 RepID=A0A376B4V4_9ASCO|nr:related to Hydroxyacylglutathione hydrolase, cytoplasmic isozyme [Saccharomycodes ludwigii]
MKIKPIKMRWLTGGVNYSYLISTTTPTIGNNVSAMKSWIIDPAEMADVLPNLNKEEIASITSIVNTHHHYDHSDGNIPLLEHLSTHDNVNTPINVIVGSKHNVPINPVPSKVKVIVPKDKEWFTLGENIMIKAIRTPCHTQDSVCYYFWDKVEDQYAIFTGDTLFTCGCGRFFEGDGFQMDNSLNVKLCKDVDVKNNLNKTFVFPGHEYTRSNVKFVRAKVYNQLNEKNKAFDELENYSNTHEMTTGVYTLQDELNFNPFMRLNDPLVRKAVGDLKNEWPTGKVMENLRKLKDVF